MCDCYEDDFETVDAKVEEVEIVPVVIAPLRTKAK